MDQNVKLMKRKALYFIVLTLVVSFLWAFLFYLLGGRLGSLNSLLAAFGATSYMFIPMLVAIYLQKFRYKEPLKDLGLSFHLNWWWLVAWIFPLLLAFLAIGISLLLPGVHYSTGMEFYLDRLRGTAINQAQLEMMKTQIATSSIPFLLTIIIQSLIYGITLNAVLAFGEEFGWRGFLQKQFDYLSFWKMSLIIGVIWGIWHAPIIIQGHNYPQHPLEGVFMMIGFTILYTPLLAYIRIKSKSVIPAAIMHGTINSTFAVSFLWIAGGNDLTVGIGGLAGFIALALGNLFLLIYDKRIAKESVM